LTFRLNPKKGLVKIHLHQQKPAEALAVCSPGSS
jgi:hypothetical protein